MVVVRVVPCGAAWAVDAAEESGWSRLGEAVYVGLAS
jgi:hypothetical protein